MLSILILAIIGFVISAYLFYVEQKMKSDITYKPVCDISDRISCSKVIQSPFARLFFVSNTIIGMGYYAVVALLALMNMGKLLVILSVGAALASCVLGYILYFKIKSFCVMCTSLYIVNFLILVIMLSHFSF
jgi:vitamin-K-epoxide reductase (warfarin-sensitive)